MLKIRQYLAMTDVIVIVFGPSSFARDDHNEGSFFCMVRDSSNDVDKSLLLMIAFNEIELATKGCMDGGMLTDK